MPLSREMQQLRAEHATLVTLSRIIRTLVRAPRPPRPTELASARRLLRDTLVRHLKCEDWALYPRLNATGDPELMRMTREFELEMGDLAANFVAYDDKWTGELVVAAWAGFCIETESIFDALAIRIEREERELYPLADKVYAALAAIDTPVRDGSTISS